MFNGQPRQRQPDDPHLRRAGHLVSAHDPGELKRQRSGPYGYVLDVDVPTIPTLPGQPNASVTFFDATTLDRTVRRKGRKIHYIEGPMVCDGTFFLLDGLFSYEGGITNTVYERFTTCPRRRPRAAGDA